MERETLLKKIIITAGDETLKYFDAPLKKFIKSHSEDYATKGDLASEKIIISAIKKNFPNDGIISEESKDYKTGSDYVWIIDPLDGTWNYAHGIPIYGVLVAVAKKDEIILGGMFFPKLKDFYFASKSKGAYRNGIRIRCSDKSDMAHLRCCGSLNPSNEEEYARQIRSLATEINDLWLTEFGTCAYDIALVASGNSHFYIHQKTKYGHIWDVAAPSIILKESGCKITNMIGENWAIKDKFDIVAANPSLHAKIMEAMVKKKK
jgi:myo-inositol-1(or 4)-monophosphatase